MLVSNAFSERFSSGEDVLDIDEAERFIGDMDISSFWEDKKQHQHHNNWFYEFVPVVRVCRTLDDPGCKIKFTGITPKPFDAVIYSNGAELCVECTCAINHYENTIKQELHKKIRNEIAVEWSNSYENPVTYGELGGKFNWGAPIEWSGIRSNRRLVRYIDGFYSRSIGELALLSMITRSIVEKSKKYSWDDCRFKPNWLLVVFDNACDFERDFLIEMLALIEGRGTGFERVYLVSISPTTCIISSQDREVRELMFRLSGGRKWIPITNDPR